MFLAKVNISKMIGINLRMGRRSRACLLAAVMALAVSGVAGCGSDSDDDADVPANATARVGDTVITKRQARALLPQATKPVLAERYGTAYLIAIEWMRREARREGLPAQPTQVAGAQRSLARATETFHQLMARTSGPPVSEQQIARFYRDNPSRYRSPEVRYIRRVPTKTRAQGIAARRKLEQGESWSTVIDRDADRTTHIPPTKSDIGVVPYSETEAFDEAIFTAQRGTFVGPVRVSRRWYVFELVSIRRLPGQSLAKVRDAIETRLEQERVERGRRKLIARLEARYLPVTVCGERFRVPNCRNDSSNQPVFLPFS